MSAEAAFYNNFESKFLMYENIEDFHFLCFILAKVCVSGPDTIRVKKATGGHTDFYFLVYLLKFAPRHCDIK